MNPQQLILHRLSKQSQQIEREPLQNIFVARKQQRQFHFCIYGLQTPYGKGFYHGILQLPQNYPFSAPKFKFLTNNGRFQVGKYVCTTFTSYHQEAWTSSWTIRTILTAILSFFLSNQGGYGTLQTNPQKKQVLALRSLQSNLQNEIFVQLFKQQLKNLGVKHPKLQEKDKRNQICLKQINLSLNDKIQLKQQTFEQEMLEESLPHRRHINRTGRTLKLLYGGLIILILVLLFVKF